MSAVVTAAAVQADADPDAFGQQAGERRDAAAQTHVRGGAMDDGQYDYRDGDGRKGVP